MARLWSSGAELNSTTINMEFGSGSNSIVVTPVRSGSYSIQAKRTTSGNCYIPYYFANPNATASFFFRAYVNIITLPNVACRLISVQNVTPQSKVSIRLNTNGTLQAYNEEDSANIGSASSALSTNTWYRIELNVNCTTIASTSVDARIDGVSFATGTVNLLSGIGGFILGSDISLTTVEMYFDDLAINDSTGSFQNSWPGAGSIVHLRPNAAGDTAAWGASTNVDEVTPDDNTTKDSSNTLNQESLYNIDTASLLGTNDTVNLVQVGVRFNGAGASSNASFKLEIEASSGGTIEQGSAITPSNTTWVTNANSVPRNYNLTLYDLPGASTTAWTKADLDTAQIGYILTATSTNAAQISTVWLLVDFTPFGSGVIFYDTFTEGASDTLLQSHTPDVGTSWTRLYSDTADLDLYAKASTDTLVSEADTSDHGVIYTADAAYPSANYYIETVFTDDDNQTYLKWYWLLRVQDKDNLYAFVIFQGASASKFYKKVAGSWTAIGSGLTMNTDFVNGDRLRIQVDGSTLTFFVNGVEKISTTDSAITAAGKAGVATGGGSALIDSTDDAGTFWQWDNFTVYDLGAVAAGGGSPLIYIPQRMRMGMGI